MDISRRLQSESKRRGPLLESMSRMTKCSDNLSQLLDQCWSLQFDVEREGKGRESWFDVQETESPHELADQFAHLSSADLALELLELIKNDFQLRRYHTRKHDKNGALT